MLARLTAILCALMIGAVIGTVLMSSATDIGSTDWSETDASNNQTPPAGWPEGMAPSAVNNSARANMGAVKRFYNRINGVKTTGGTADAQTLTYDVAGAAYVTGERYAFKVGTSLNTTTTTPTLNVNSLGAKTLKDSSGAALVFGAALAAGAYQEGLYDGTNMRIMSLPWKSSAWTPVFSVGSGSITSQSGSGFWFRIGPLVFISGQVTATTVSSPGGNLTVTGLPYTVHNSAGAAGGIAMSTGQFNLSTGYNLAGIFSTNDTNFVIQELVDNAGSNPAGSTLVNGSVVNFTGHYFTSAAF